MSVRLLAHTQLSADFNELLTDEEIGDFPQVLFDMMDAQAIALTAIRTCYSPNKPSEIIALEGEKYFGHSASDGEEGTEADRLIRHIVRSRHLSTLEHASYTFAIEGVSRALLAQLTRHRVGFSFSVQSQRYVKFGSDDRSGGFDYVVPDSVKKNDTAYVWVGDEGFLCSETVEEAYIEGMAYLQRLYDTLRKCGVPAEDARAVLPNAAATNLTMTANLRALLDFYAKRKSGRGAQSEITQLAERLREEVVKVDPWTAPFFDAV